MLVSAPLSALTLRRPAQRCHQVGLRAPTAEVVPSQPPQAGPRCRRRHRRRRRHRMADAAHRRRRRRSCCPRRIRHRQPASLGVRTPAGLFVAATVWSPNVWSSWCQTRLGPPAKQPFSTLDRTTQEAYLNQKFPRRTPRHPLPAYPNCAGQASKLPRKIKNSHTAGC